MEAINQDTPQEQTANPNDVTSAFDTVQQFGATVNEGSNESSLAVEDAFKSMTEETVEATPQEGQPANTEEPITQEQPYEAKNDEKRFEYWQSQAAKRENEMKTMQAELQHLQNDPLGSLVKRLGLTQSLRVLGILMKKNHGNLIYLNIIS